MNPGRQRPQAALPSSLNSVFCWKVFESLLDLQVVAIRLIETHIYLIGVNIYLRGDYINILSMYKKYMEYCMGAGEAGGDFIIRLYFVTLIMS
jgi:hypothetical protein